MKIKTIKIDSDVEDVLRAAKMDGNNLALQGQLNSALYKKTMKVLEQIGFEWNRKLKCHVGKDDSADLLRDALNAGAVVNQKQTYQFFETPVHLAERMVELACIHKGDCVLEPSAGKGRIVQAILEDCPDLFSLDVCEINPAMTADLMTVCGDMENVEIVAQDFLLLKGEWNKIVMNPPFNAGQDMAHVRHAYDSLAPDGRLVALMSPGWMTKEDTKSALFREWYELEQKNGGASVPEFIPKGTFQESGTSVETVLIVMSK